jgi:hypothetical protein
VRACVTAARLSLFCVPGFALPSQPAALDWRLAASPCRHVPLHARESRNSARTRGPEARCARGAFLTAPKALERECQSRLAATRCARTSSTSALALATLAHTRAPRLARREAQPAVFGTQSTAVLPLSRPRSHATHSQSRASPPPDGGALWRCRRHKRGSCLRHTKKW